MRSAGLSKEEILRIAREKVQGIIDIDVEEKDDFFELVLKTKCDFYPKSTAKVAIWKQNYEGERIEKLEQVTAETMRKKLHESINSFSIEFADTIVKKLGLESVYKQRYTDNNFLYKVERYYIERNGNSTYSRDLLLYNIEKLKEKIPSYEPLRRLLELGMISHDNREGMREFMRAIGERTQQLFFAYDTMAKILGTEKTDNDILFVFNFHLWHFISLVKSLGDNLAWLLNLYLKLNLDHHYIDLLNDHFKNKLENANASIASLIYDNPKLEDFKIADSYRDIIQHRHALHALEVMIGYPPRARKILIPKNPDSLVRGNIGLTKQETMPINFVVENTSEGYLGDNEAAIHFEKTPLEDDFYYPMEFSERFIDFVSEVFTKVLERIWIEFSREPIGEIVNYYAKVGVAEIKVKGTLRIGDSIVIEGSKGYFLQKVESMEISNTQVSNCKDCNVGIKVNNTVRYGEKAYKIVDRVPENKKTKSPVRF